MKIVIGKHISEDVSKLLRDFSTSNDRADVSNELHISPSTLREITYRTRPVTLNNFNAVKKLLEVAKANAEHTQKASTKGAKDLKKILDLI